MEGRDEGVQGRAEKSLAEGGRVQRVRCVRCVRDQITGSLACPHFTLAHCSLTHTHSPTYYSHSHSLTVLLFALYCLTTTTQQIALILVSTHLTSLIIFTITANSQHSSFLPLPAQNSGSKCSSLPRSALFATFCDLVVAVIITALSTMANNHHHSQPPPTHFPDAFSLRR